VASLVSLIGFMGSGKSTVGAAVAQQLQWEFIDLDTEVERLAGASVAAIFEERGEEVFRCLEREVLDGVLLRRGESSIVLALGGGTLEDPQNRRTLTQTGGLVFLDEDLSVAWARSAGSERPLARDESLFSELWRRRRPTYLAAAQWVLPLRGESVRVVAQQVCELARMGGSAWPRLWGRRLAHVQRDSIIIGGVGSLSTLGWQAERLRDGRMGVHVITDANVLTAQGKRVLGALGGSSEALVLDPGEGSKSVAGLGRCWNWLAERRARRDDVVVALGGGVIGDIAGFAAATYQRGVSVWQIPTSLIAQVDSSVGGKTAVNLDAGKNLVGAFYQPDLVVIDPELLGTLPDVEYTGGMGEVVKHALLSSLAGVKWLEQNSESVRKRDECTLSELVKRNVWLKAGVVEEDERESGRRVVLNLGHTTAHALEAALGYGRVSHGQAVALGLLVSLAVSERMLGLDKAVRKRTEALLRELGLRVSMELPAVDALLNAASRDKKVKSGSSGFVGLRAVGDPVWGIDVPARVFEEALEVIRG
jgi:shikimate kinase/3-dehydroquinate synthase